MKDGMRKHAREACVLLVLLVTGIVLGGCGLLDLLPTLPPDQAPAGVAASTGEFSDRIRITWSAVERATAYKVFRAVSAAGPFQVLDNPATTALDDLDVEAGRLYWYKVRACNTTGCGPESSVVAGYAGYPPAPVNVQASDGIYPGKIVITWDPVPGATHYQVFRDRFEDGTYGTYLGESTTAQFDDTTAAVGLRYWYKVQACNGYGCSSVHASPADSGCRAPCIPGGSLDTEG